MSKNKLFVLTAFALMLIASGIVLSPITAGLEVTSSPELTVTHLTYWQKISAQISSFFSPASVVSQTGSATINPGTNVVVEETITLGCSASVASCANGLSGSYPSITWICTFYTPSGTPYDQTSLTMSSNINHCGAASHSRCTWTIPSNAQTGTWTVQVKATMPDNLYCILGSASEQFQVTGTCSSICTVGSKQCYSQRQYVQCETVNGCPNWVTYNCGSTSSCVNGVCNADVTATTTLAKSTTTISSGAKSGWGGVCSYSETGDNTGKCESGSTCNADNRCCHIEPVEIWSSTQGKCISMNEKQLNTFTCEGWKKKGAGVLDWLQGTQDCGNQQCNIGVNAFNCCSANCQSPPNKCSTNDDCIAKKEGDTCYKVPTGGSVCYVASQGTPPTRTGEAGGTVGQCPTGMAICASGDGASSMNFHNGTCGFPDGVQISSNEASQTDKCCSLAYYQTGGKYYCSQYGIIPLEALHCDDAWNTLANGVCKNFVTRIANVLSFGTINLACKNSLNNYYNCKTKECNSKYAICKQSSDIVTCWFSKQSCSISNWWSKSWTNLTMQFGDTIAFIIVAFIIFLILLSVFGLLPLFVLIIKKVIHL